MAGSTSGKSAAAAELAIVRAAPPGSMGFDVSAGGTVWSSLKPKWTFAFIESTQGATLHNAAFGADWHGAAGAGIVRGAYHFFYAKTSTPQQQADNLLNFVTHNGGWKPGDLPPVLDVEEATIQKQTAAVVKARFKTFADEVTARITA